MAASIVTVNGVRHEVEASPDETLLDVLRESLCLTGAKYGCGEGQCGACSVLVDGELARACTIAVEAVEGRHVTTIEGLAAPAMLHRVQRAFAEMHAFQCGFCVSGMIVSAAALLAMDPRPSVDRIASWLDPNLCRCCAYPQIVRAVQRAAEADDLRGESPSVALGRWAGDFTGGRPSAPWDLTDAEARDYFAVLSEGLVVVVPPAQAAPGMWAPTGGAWLHLGSDGMVRAFTGKVEVGQGTRDALRRIVAEELCARLDQVHVVMGDTDVCPFDVGTFGSRSMPTVVPDLRRAAAVARRALVVRAAPVLGCAVSDVIARDGALHDPAGETRVEFGDLVIGACDVEFATSPESEEAAPPARMATESSLDERAVAMVTGVHEFPTDLTRPDMLYGAVLHPPELGARLRAVELAGAQAMRGVIVVHEHSLVAVAAPDRVTVERAFGAITADWERPLGISDATLVDHLRSHPIDVSGWETSFVHEDGDVEQALAVAPVRVARTYTTAFLAHAPLETRTAIAEWDEGRLTVWTGTQHPFETRRVLAEVLGVDERDVRVLVPDTGGGFGGKDTVEPATAAALLARASGRPVKVEWTRADEFAWGHVRPAAVVDVRAGATSDGLLAAWDFTNINAGRAAIDCPYDVTDRRFCYQAAASPLRQGPYRALAATANNFARESCIDEVAWVLQLNPLEFRLRNLSDDRLAAVLREVAECVGWSARGRGAGGGVGLAAGVEKGGRVATAVEVRASDTGDPEIIRIVTAFECGRIVDRNNLIAQVEGATVMGLGGALFEAVHFEQSRILTTAFSQYRVPRFTDVPPIEVVLLESDQPSAGAGETPMIAVAPAVANAWFAATGERAASMPLFPGPSPLPSE